MTYDAGLSSRSIDPKIKETAEKFFLKRGQNRPTDNYEFSRVGEPVGVVDFDGTREDRELLLSHYRSKGRKAHIPTLADPNFMRHVVKFRCVLDLYDSIQIKKVFSSDEVYVRCLRDGVAFTEFLKKSRASSLKAKTTLCEVELEEEHVHPEYCGYDSIFPERSLIHWDDTASIDDVKYCFLPAKEIDEEGAYQIFKEFLGPIRVGDPPSLAVSLLDTLKASSMYDPVNKRSTLMREFWSEDVKTGSVYFAKRTVVPTTPGSTRDTGIGDPGTVMKVKIITALCRAISESCPTSANCSSEDLSARLHRLRRRQIFLHFDFKKYGLTFPRALANLMLRALGEKFDMDLSFLYITDFVIEIDGKYYRTERGTCLGWIDCLNSLVVQALLQRIFSELDIHADYLSFNDDVEIGLWASNDPKSKVDLVRSYLIYFFSLFDIPISVSKVYASFGSVFLEDYAFYDKFYNLNMTKASLTIDIYAKSLCAIFPYRAKLLFSVAFPDYVNEYILDRCIHSCPIEFSAEDDTLPLELGGWMPNVSGLNYCFSGASPERIALFTELSRYSPPRYSSRPTQVADNKEIAETVALSLVRAETAKDAVKVFGEVNFEDTNFEAENIEAALVLFNVNYHGRTSDLADRVKRAYERSIKHVVRPPE
jgi:hypothetical protein